MKITNCVWMTFICLIMKVQAQAFDPILAGKLQQKIDSIRTANNLKGISACVMDPRVGTWKGVTGISHTGVPISSDMAFGIGSNTKLFTGVLLLKLVEQNIIHIDDSLHQYLPNFKHVNPNITIRQLLNHTSGIADITNAVGYADSILSDPYRIFTPAEVLTWIGPPLFSPGTSWNYSNTNYILAGMIAESATGQSFGKLLRDSILEPLQLDSTFYGAYDSVLNPVAHPWQGGTDQFSTPRKSLLSAAGSSGAMYATSGEMVQWFHALMHGQVVNQNAFKLLTTFVGSGNYGIGLYRTKVLGRTIYQHGGTIWGGYNSVMVYDTATGIIICILVNQNPAQAFSIALPLLMTLLNNPTGFHENTMTKALNSVYPNPTNGVVQIEMPDEIIQNIKVYNLQGQLIFETSETRFTLSEYQSGTYFIKAQTNKGLYSFKLIKQ